jgi:hypothetical protein
MASVLFLEEAQLSCVAMEYANEYYLPKMLTNKPKRQRRE